MSFKSLRLQKYDFLANIGKLDEENGRIKAQFFHLRELEELKGDNSL